APPRAPPPAVRERSHRPADAPPHRLRRLVGRRPGARALGPLRQPFPWAARGVAGAAGAVRGFRCLAALLARRRDARRPARLLAPPARPRAARAGAGHRTGAAPELELPPARPRLASRAPRGGSRSLRLDGDTVLGLDGLGRRARVTPF